MKERVRFAPTRAADPWDGIRIADKFSPVCPQRLPNIINETAALEKMPKGRLEYLKRLLPFLQNQSEDCLYLNIFSPMHASSLEQKLPVIVFLHGESFEWNSGNPFDGTVLASYGEVVVVTINYRLGILGFLNANPSPHIRARVANYGLMDQMAALHWVNQNIQRFGGDPQMVTMAGHGSGAACINFLMSSPTMVPGLFNRAILLSGSSHSSWALVDDPVIYAIKLAKESNCTVPDDLFKHHEQIVDCLRDIPIENLLAVDIQPPSFLNAFGPSVDGVVIRSGHVNQEMDDAPMGGRGQMKRSQNLPGRYDLLFGVVTGEALWRFSAHDIQNGFEGERRDRILRTYVRNAYTYHLSEIFYTIVNEYTDWERTNQHPINTRDAAVQALSDAQFVAPVVHTGDTFAPNPPQSGSGPEDEETQKSFFYVFDYQTKDGDYPQRMGTVHGEDLPYVFGAPLVEGFNHFPHNYTKSEVALSEAMMIYWKLHKAGMEDVIARHNLFKNHDDMNLYEGIVKPDSRYAFLDDSYKRRNNITEFVLGAGITTMEPLPFTTCIPLGNYSSYGGVSGHATTNIANSTQDTLAGYDAAGYAAYSTALSVTIAIGCSLLILNVLIFAGVYYQRDKTRLEVKSLQKQYGQQRPGHQQSFDPIKHAHFHLGHSQSANVIVDVENHDTGALILSSTGEKSPHICSNSMQINVMKTSSPGHLTGTGCMTTTQAQTKVPNNSCYKTGTKQNSGGGGGDSVQMPATAGVTIPIKTTQNFSLSNNNRNNNNNSNLNTNESSFTTAVPNSGMMTLPKSSNLSMQQHMMPVQYSNSRNDATACMTLPRNPNSLNNPDLQQKLPPNGSVIGVHTHTLGRHPHSHRPQQIIHQSSSCSRSNSPADNRPLLSSSSQSSSATTATISSQQQTQQTSYQQGIPKAAMDEMRV
uniref:CSON010476 protein n=1 Tax=Culicoides sonorensis TaxID=179676 RepID=A0A336M1U8_CULSO